MATSRNLQDASGPARVIVTTGAINCNAPSRPYRVPCRVAGRNKTASEKQNTNIYEKDLTNYLPLNRFTNSISHKGACPTGCFSKHLDLTQPDIDQSQTEKTTVIEVHRLPERLYTSVVQLWLGQDGIGWPSGSNKERECSRTVYKPIRSKLNLCADEALRKAYEQITRPNAQPSEPKQDPLPPPSGSSIPVDAIRPSTARVGPALRGTIGLLLAAFVCVAVIASQSSFRDEPSRYRPSGIAAHSEFCHSVWKNLAFPISPPHRLFR